MSQQATTSISSFYPAAFVYAKGGELIGIHKSADDKRAQFLFADPQRCDELLKVFNFSKEDAPEALIDARKMVQAIKMLKEKLYQ